MRERFHAKTRVQKRTSGSISAANAMLCAPQWPPNSSVLPFLHRCAYGEPRSTAELGEAPASADAAAGTARGAAARAAAARARAAAAPGWVADAEAVLVGRRNANELGANAMRKHGLVVALRAAEVRVLVVLRQLRQQRRRVRRVALRVSWILIKSFCVVRRAAVVAGGRGRGCAAVRVAPVHHAVCALRDRQRRRPRGRAIAGVATAAAAGERQHEQQ